MAITATNDKLRFLSGLAKNLPSAISNGSIYVTTDEQAMYVDMGDKRLRLGNLRIVENEAALDTIDPKSVDQLVLVKTGNMLVRWNGTSWVQLNHTMLTNVIKDVTTVYTASSNVGTITHNINANDGSGEKISAVAKISSGNANTATITADDTNGLVIKTADTVNASALSAVADGDTSAKIVLTETVSGYDVTGAEKSGSSTTEVKFTATGATVSSTQAGVIHINGGISNITDGFDANGQYKVTVALPDGDSKATAGVTPTITYGENNAKSAKFVNGTASLDAYTKSEVDTKIANELKTAQAMVFKGTVTPGTPLAKEQSHGDTYIVGTAGTIQATLANGSTEVVAQNAKVGDLLIATGEEGANGLITGDVEWQYVPAGNDDIAMYEGVASDAQLVLNENYAGAPATAVATLKVGEGLAGAGSGSTLTISHKAGNKSAETATAANEAAAVTAIVGVESDDFGHVTKVTTKTFNLVNYALKSVTAKATAIEGGAAIATGVELMDGAPAMTASVNIKTEADTSAYVGVEGNDIVVGMHWYTF